MNKLIISEEFVQIQTLHDANMIMYVLLLLLTRA